MPYTYINGKMVWVEPKVEDAPTVPTAPQTSGIVPDLNPPKDTGAYDDPYYRPWAVPKEYKEQYDTDAEFKAAYDAAVVGAQKEYNKSYFQWADEYWKQKAAFDQNAGIADAELRDIQEKISMWGTGNYGQFSQQPSLYKGKPGSEDAEGILTNAKTNKWIQEKPEAAGGMGGKVMEAPQALTEEDLMAARATLDIDPTTAPTTGWFNTLISQMLDAVKMTLGLNIAMLAPQALWFGYGTALFTKISKLAEETLLFPNFLGTQAYGETPAMTPPGQFDPGFWMGAGSMATSQAFMGPAQQEWSGADPTMNKFLSSRPRGTPKAVDPLTGQMGYQVNIPGQGLVFMTAEEYTTKDWQSLVGRAPTSLDEERWEQTYNTQRWLTKVNDKGNIVMDWSKMFGSVNFSELNPLDIISSSQGMADIALSLMLHPERAQQFMDLVDKNGTTTEAINTLQDPWMEMFFNTVTNPLLIMSFIGPEIQLATGAQIGLNASGEVAVAGESVAQWAPQLTKMGQLLSPFYEGVGSVKVAQVIQDMIMPAGWAMNKAAQPLFNKLFQGGMSWMQTRYNASLRWDFGAKGLPAGVTTTATAASAAEAFAPASNSMMDKMLAISKQSVLAMFSDTIDTTLRQSALVVSSMLNPAVNIGVTALSRATAMRDAFETSMNTVQLGLSFDSDPLLSKLSTFHQDRLVEAFTAFGNEGLMSVEDILNAYGPFAHRRGGKMSWDDFAAQLHPDNPEEQVAHIVSRAITDQRRKELGIPLPRPGSLQANMDFAQGIAREFWLSLNGKYMGGNFTDNTMKTILGGYVPAFGWNSARQTEAIFEDMGIVVPTGISKTLVLGDLGLVLGQNLKMSELPWPLGNSGAELYERLTLKSLPSQWTDWLAGDNAMAKIMRNVNIARAAAWSLNLSSHIEEMARANIFLQAYNSIAAAKRPAFVESLKATLDTASGLIDAFADGQIQKIKDIDVWTQRNLGTSPSNMPLYRPLSSMVPWNQIHDPGVRNLVWDLAGEMDALDTTLANKPLPEALSAIDAVASTWGQKIQEWFEGSIADINERTELAIEALANSSGYQIANPADISPAIINNLEFHKLMRTNGNVKLVVSGDGIWTWGKCIYEAESKLPEVYRGNPTTQKFVITLSPANRLTVSSVNPQVNVQDPAFINAMKGVYPLGFDIAPEIDPRKNVGPVQVPERERIDIVDTEGVTETGLSIVQEIANAPDVFNPPQYDDKDALENALEMLGGGEDPDESGETWDTLKEYWLKYEGGGDLAAWEAFKKEAHNMDMFHSNAQILKGVFENGKWTWSRFQHMVYGGVKLTTLGPNYIELEPSPRVSTTGQWITRNDDDKFNEVAIDLINRGVPTNVKVRIAEYSSGDATAPFKETTLGELAAQTPPKFHTGPKLVFGTSMNDASLSIEFITDSAEPLADPQEFKLMDLLLKPANINLPGRLGDDFRGVFFGDTTQWVLGYTDMHSTLAGRAQAAGKTAAYDWIWQLQGQRYSGGSLELATEGDEDTSVNNALTSLKEAGFPGNTRIQLVGGWDLGNDIEGTIDSLIEDSLHISDAGPAAIAKLTDILDNVAAKYDGEIGKIEPFASGTDLADMRNFRTRGTIRIPLSSVLDTPKIFKELADQIGDFVLEIRITDPNLSGTMFIIDPDAQSVNALQNYPGNRMSEQLALVPGSHYRYILSVLADAEVAANAGLWAVRPRDIWHWKQGMLDESEYLNQIYNTPEKNEAEAAGISALTASPYPPVRAPYDSLNDFLMQGGYTSQMREQVAKMFNEMVWDNNDQITGNMPVTITFRDGSTLDMPLENFTGGIIGNNDPIFITPDMPISFDKHADLSILLRGKPPVFDDLQYKNWWTALLEKRQDVRLFDNQPDEGVPFNSLTDDVEQWMKTPGVRYQLSLTNVDDATGKIISAPLVGIWSPDYGWRVDVFAKVDDMIAKYGEPTYIIGTENLLSTGLGTRITMNLPRSMGITRLSQMLGGWMQYSNGFRASLINNKYDALIHFSDGATQRVNEFVETLKRVDGYLSNELWPQIKVQGDMPVVLFPDGITIISTEHGETVKGGQLADLVGMEDHDVGLFFYPNVDKTFALSLFKDMHTTYHPDVVEGVIRNSLGGPWQEDMLSGVLNVDDFLNSTDSNVVIARWNQRQHLNREKELKLKLPNLPIVDAYTNKDASELADFAQKLIESGADPRVQLRIFGTDGKAPFNAGTLDEVSRARKAYNPIGKVYNADITDIVSDPMVKGAYHPGSGSTIVMDIANPHSPTQAENLKVGPLSEWLTFVKTTGPDGIVTFQLGKFEGQVAPDDIKAMGLFTKAAGFAPTTIINGGGGTIATVETTTAGTISLNDLTPKQRTFMEDNGIMDWFGPNPTAMMTFANRLFDTQTGQGGMMHAVMNTSGHFAWSTEVVGHARLWEWVQASMQDGVWLIKVPNQPLSIATSDWNLIPKLLTEMERWLPEEFKNDRFFNSMPLSITCPGGPPVPAGWIGEGGPRGGGVVAEWLGRKMDNINSYTKIMHDLAEADQINLRKSEMTKISQGATEALNALTQWRLNMNQGFRQDSNRAASTQEAWQKARDDANTAKQMYRDEMQSYSDYAESEVNRVLFDYMMKNNMEGFLRYYSPFTTWQLRNPLLWAQLASQNPGFLSVLVQALYAEEVDRRQRNLTERFKGVAGFETPGGGFAGTKTAPFMMSLLSQMQAPFEPEQPTGQTQSKVQQIMQWMIQGGRTMGISPWPWWQQVGEEMGVLPQGTTQWSFGPIQRMAELALQATGINEPGEGIFGDTDTSKMLREYAVNRRVSEMEAEGLISHDEAINALNNPESDAYKKAYEFVRKESTIMSAINLFTPLTTKYATPGEVRIRELKAGATDFMARRKLEEQYPFLRTYNLAGAEPQQVAVEKMYDKYDKMLAPYDPWSERYKEIVVQRANELDGLVGIRDVDTGAFFTDPVAPSDARAEETTLFRLQALEPRVSDYVSEAGIVNWEQYNADLDAYLNNIETVSQQVGIKISIDRYMQYRYRYDTPKQVAYDMYKQDREEAWKFLDTIKPTGSRFHESLQWALEQQFQMDMSAGFTREESMRMKASNASLWLIEGLPYEYYDKLVSMYTQDQTLVGYADEVAKMLGIDSAHMSSLVEDLNVKLPGVYGNQSFVEQNKNQFYDYYYNLTPIEQQQVLRNLGFTTHPSDWNDGDFVEAWTKTASALEYRSSLMNNGALMIDDPHRAIFPEADVLTPEEQTELNQVRVDFFRYNADRGAGRYGTWTDLMTKYYSDPTSPSGRFWEELNAVALTSEAFNDPVLGAILNSVSRSNFDFTDSQYQAALEYYWKNKSRFVNPELTQSMKDHPDWVQAAGAARQVLNADKLLDMESMKAEYYALSKNLQKEWRTENPARWAGLGQYLATQKAQELAEPKYLYFYNNSDYKQWFGSTLPDKVPPAEAKALSDKWLKLVTDAFAFQNDPGKWTWILSQLLGAYVVTGSSGGGGSSSSSTKKTATPTPKPPTDTSSGGSGLPTMPTMPPLP